jgi:hypothetical protein
LVPGSRAEEVIVNALGTITSVIAADLICAGLPLSLTVAVKLDVPIVVGIPEIMPLVGVRLNPAGRLPEVIDHV